MPDRGYVYILASSFKHLYIGVTSSLEQRIADHKNHRRPNSFTARYAIDHLVYIERHPLLLAAIAREKQLKRWSRTKKIRLVVATNPTWKDLSLEWGSPIDPPPINDNPQSHILPKNSNDLIPYTPPTSQKGRHLDRASGVPNERLCSVGWIASGEIPVFRPCRPHTTDIRYLSPPRASA